MPKTPFVVVDTKCPVCGRTARNRYIKSKLYSVLASDIDGRPTEIKWLDADFRHVSPEDYYLWFCPTCFYTDGREAFRSPEERGKKFDLLRDKLLALNRDSESPLRRIGSVVHYGGDVIPPKSTMAAHLLAVYEQELLTPTMRDHEKLARFYVRTGWQFSWATNLMGRLNKDIAAFVAEARLTSPDLPDSYSRCASRAIEELMTSMIAGSGEPDVKREIRILALISSLHRKLGDTNSALDCTKRIFNAARERKNALKRALDSGVTHSATGGSRDKMMSDMEWMGNAIREVKEVREIMLDEIAQKEAPAIEAFIAQSGGVPTPGVIDALRQRKFNYHSIRQVVARYGTELAGESDWDFEESLLHGLEASQAGRGDGHVVGSLWRIAFEFAIGKR
jgi:hypothetical protein